MYSKRMAKSQVLCGSKQEGVPWGQLALCQPLAIHAEEEGLPWDAPELNGTGAWRVLLNFDKEVIVKPPHQHYI